MSNKEILSGIRALKSAVKQALRETGGRCHDHYRKAEKEKQNAMKLAIVQAIPAGGMSKLVVAELLIHEYTSMSTAKGSEFRQKIVKAGETAERKWYAKNPTRREQLETIQQELEGRELAYMIGAVKDEPTRAWLTKTMNKFQSIKAKE